MFVFYVCMTAGKCYFHSLICEVFFLLFYFIVTCLPLIQRVSILNSYCTCKSRLNTGTGCCWMQIAWTFFQDTHKIRVAGILNDAVGTLMSCAHKRDSCRIGVVVGKSKNSSEYHTGSVTEYMYELLLNWTSKQ